MRLRSRRTNNQLPESRLRRTNWICGRPAPFPIVAIATAKRVKEERTTATGCCWRSPSLPLWPRSRRILLSSARKAPLTYTEYIFRTKLPNMSVFDIYRHRQQANLPFTEEFDLILGTQYKPYSGALYNRKTWSNDKVKRNRAR